MKKNLAKLMVSYHTVNTRKVKKKNHTDWIEYVDFNPKVEHPKVEHHSC